MKTSIFCIILQCLLLTPCVSLGRGIPRCSLRLWLHSVRKGSIRSCSLLFLFLNIILFISHICLNISIGKNSLLKGTFGPGYFSQEFRWRYLVVLKGLLTVSAGSYYFWLYLTKSIPRRAFQTGEKCFPSESANWMKLNWFEGSCLFWYFFCEALLKHIGWLFFIVSLTVPAYNWREKKRDVFSTCRNKAYWQSTLYIPGKKVAWNFLFFF